MTRSRALIGTGALLFVAPGTVAGIIPRMISDWEQRAPFFSIPATRAVGWLLIAAGVALVLEAFLRFAIDGLGTPAPIAPPQHLVIRGSYHVVRNPMYLAVVAIILGQALVLGDINLVWYAALVFAVMHLFVIAYEEPTLKATFGSDYVDYCRRVGRWIPHL